MKTFLAFITGLLSGTFLGLGWASFVMLSNKSVREYFEKDALD